MSRPKRYVPVGFLVVLGVSSALFLGGFIVNRSAYSSVEALADELELDTVGEIVAVERTGAWVFMGAGPHYKVVVSGPDAYDEISDRLLAAGYVPTGDPDNCLG